MPTKFPNLSLIEICDRSDINSTVKAPAAVLEQQRARKIELTETIARLEKLYATFSAAQ